MQMSASASTRSTFGRNSVYGASAHESYTYTGLLSHLGNVPFTNGECWPLSVYAG